MPNNPDPHLARWRAQQAAGAGPAGGLPGQSQNAQQQQQAAEQRQKQEAAMEEQRRLMLKQLLSDEAGERLANIRLVKPDKARQVETLVLNAARSGRVGGKVSDAQLKDLLSQVSEQTEHRPTVIRSRRNAFGDDDDDDDLLNEEF